MIEPTKLAFLNILLFVVFMFKWWPSATNCIIRKSSSNEHTGLLWIGVILFCVYAGWDTDYEHYYWIFVDLFDKPESVLTTHLEIVYVYITYFCSFENYSIFRLIVWGCAVLLFRLVLRSYNLDNQTTVVMFVLFNLLYFSYARVSLSISLFLYGYTILFHIAKNRFPLILLGFTFIVASLFFHKSAVILLLCLPFVFISLKFSKLLILFFLFPLVCQILDFSMSFLMFEDNENDLLKVGKAEGYIANPQSVSYGFVGLVILILEKCTYFYVLYLTWIYIYGKNNNVLRSIRLLLNLAIILLYISISLHFCGTGHVLERRVFLLSYLPLFCCVAYTVKNGGVNKKQFLLFSTLAFLFSFLKLLYYYYVYLVR